MFLPFQATHLRRLVGAEFEEYYSILSQGSQHVHYAVWVVYSAGSLLVVTFIHDSPHTSDEPRRCLSSRLT